MTVRRVLSRTPTSVTEYVRDEHGPGAKLEEVHIHTKINDDAHVERNKRIRLEGLLPRGRKMSVLDNAEVQFAFSIPPMVYHFLLKKERDLMDQIQSKDEQTRTAAARRFALLYPQYCMTASNR